MDQQRQHPDDERLAAFAAGDGEASLAAHVDTCDRCAALVADLTSLRASLAALPDLAPHRPLRYLPPVEATPAGGFPTLVRRLFAPAMAAGMALVVMGSVGMAATGPMSAGSSAGSGAGDTVVNYGAEDAGASAAEAAPSAAEAAPSAAEAAPSAAAPGVQSDTFSERASASNRARDEGEVAALEPTDDHDAGADLLAEGSPAMPWLAITIAGAVLLVGALILRWTVVPRAPDPPAYPGA